MQAKSVRRALAALILGIFIAGGLDKVVLVRAIFILAALTILLIFLSLPRKKEILLLVLALLAACLRTSVLPSDQNIPKEFEAIVSQDTTPAAYGSLTMIKTADGLSLRLIGERYPEFRAGDKIAVHLEDQQPDHGGFVVGEATLLAENQGSWLIRQLVAVRRVFIKAVGQVLPEPQASFAAGTLVGGSASLPADLKEALSVSGLSHILAASGYNFSLLLIFISLLLRFLPFRRQTLALLFIIPVFAVIAGASPPVLRAGTMAAFALAAILLGRISAAKTALLWAAALMLLFNPYYIRADLGWQLSFLATLGLVWLLPLAEKLLGRELLGFESDTFGEKTKNYLLSLLAATLAAQIATAPLLIYTFGVFSLVALPANLLVLPLIPAIMIGTALSAVASFAWVTLGQLLALPVWLASTFIFEIAELAVSFSFSQIFIKLSVVQVAIIYAVVGAATLFLSAKLINHRHGQKI